jgi:hypothetical protein
MDMMGRQLLEGAAQKGMAALDEYMVFTLSLEALVRVDLNG